MGGKEPVILFHPDYNRRLRHFTGSIGLLWRKPTRGLSEEIRNSEYRRWRFSLRPEKDKDSVATRDAPVKCGYISIVSPTPTSWIGMCPCISALASNETQWQG